MGSLWQNPHATTAFSLDPTDKSQKRITDEAHLAFIRKLPSIISEESPCEACHVRYADPDHRKRKTPKGRKPDDCWVVPMTPEEHRCQHGGNEKNFWEHIGIDPLEIARRLYSVSGDIEAGRKIIMDAKRNAK
ncbi:hypothetical protein [Roseibium album]|uniref:hypothetical protein n=1 Tax=Roseibium album TaxID=311410 RepID=UPI00391CDE3A